MRSKIPAIATKLFAADRNIASGALDNLTLEMHKFLTKVHSEIVVVSTDIVGFTALSSTMDPMRLAQLLDTLFKAFDGTVEQYNLHKMDTVGDACK